MGARRMQRFIKEFAGGFAGAIVALLFAAIPFGESAAQSRIDPLPPEEAFVFSAEQNGRTARIVFSMPDDFYLYRERFAIVTETDGFQVLQVRFPPAELYDDPFFGATEIYEGGAVLEADISGEGEYELKVISQGCDRQLGICYPPQTHIALLHSDGSDGTTANKIANKAANEFGDGESNSFAADEAAAAAKIISDASLWKIIAAFFGFGLLLAFTPCVLPMIPILLGIIGGDSGRRRALLSTAAYIGGVVVAYTALGIAAGLSGQFLAPILQQPPMLIASSAVMLILAASMFGAYDLQAPAFLRKAGGRGGGAFMMGALSAAIVSPCVAAPLVGALIYIGNTGDAIVGGAALFSLSLGMSVPLAIAGIGGAHWLPKAGAWTADVKLILGALLCGAAVWISSSLLPPQLTMLLYGAIAVFCGVVMFGAEFRGIKAAGVVFLLWGGALIVGAAGGGNNPLSPLSAFVGEQKSQKSPAFLPVRSPAELQSALAAANRPAMLEFYADWCISCKEMEMFTFADSRVQERMGKMLLLRADVTANDENARALLSQFGLYGPPAILFFAADGKLISGARVSGYQSADKFLQTMNAAGV